MGNKKRRAGRNIKIDVTNDITHMGVTEEEYKIIEKHFDTEVEAKLNPKRKVLLTAEEHTRLEQLRMFSAMTSSEREIKLYRAEVGMILDRGKVRRNEDK